MARFKRGSGNPALSRMVSQDTRSRTVQGLRVALVGLGVATAAVFWILAQLDWDATVFIGVGEQAVEIREFAEERLGQVFLRAGDGHDGKFFFVQAHDPWVLNPEENAMILDRPLYRSQRMLYPLIAGGFGLLDSEAIVWGLLVVNLIGLGLGTWAVAMVATEMGMSAWFGLAFLLNLGFVSEFNVSGAGIIAGAAGFAAVAMVLRSRFALAVVLLAVAALTREVMLLTAAGVAWWLWRSREQRRDAVLAAIVPIAAVVGWALYLRARLGMTTGASQIREIGLPFVGFVEALAQNWPARTVDLLVGLTIMLLLVLFIRRALISDHLLGKAFVGLAALSLFFTAPVWHSYFDITRAIAPVITAFVLLVAAPEGTEQRTSVRP